ncbi:MAG: hypothetical protein WCI04_05380 [archaeon]
MEKNNELDKCFKIGLLKSASPSTMSSKKSVVQADFFIEEA